MEKRSIVHNPARDSFIESFKPVDHRQKPHASIRLYNNARELEYKKAKRVCALKQKRIVRSETQLNFTPTINQYHGIHSTEGILSRNRIKPTTFSSQTYERSMKECSFAPEIGKRSRKLAKTAKLAGPRYESLYQTHRSKELHGLTQFTFSPRLLTKSYNESHLSKKSFLERLEVSYRKFLTNSLKLRKAQEQMKVTSGRPLFQSSICGSTISYYSQKHLL